MTVGILELDEVGHLPFEAFLPAACAPIDVFGRELVGAGLGVKRACRGRVWGSNLDLGTYHREILKPLSDLRFRLDLFPYRSAIAAHQPLIQPAKPLTDYPLLKPAVSMQ
jgi:hypothetical protein